MINGAILLLELRTKKLERLQEILLDKIKMVPTSMCTRKNVKLPHREESR